jgi:pyruvate/2-oxoglutarate/acetoin dehydrogenase E1 component
MRYLSRGQLSVPLTVRAAAGAGLGFGCQHSQMLEHWFTTTPGLKVVVPSDPANAYGLLRAAIRDDDPTVFLEHKALYGDRGHVTVGETGVLTLGRAAQLRSGDDVTIVAVGATVHTAFAAADLADGSWTADVIDLQTLVPWDQETVIESVSRTGRLVVVEEGVENGGWGADIVAGVVREAFSDLVLPPLRITAPDAPIPYAGSLEARFLPSAEYVAEQIGSLLRDGRHPSPWWREAVAR